MMIKTSQDARIGLLIDIIRGWFSFSIEARVVFNVLTISSMLALLVVFFLVSGLGAVSCSPESIGVRGTIFVWLIILLLCLQLLLTFFKTWYVCNTASECVSSKSYCSLNTLKKKKVIENLVRETKIFLCTVYFWERERYLVRSRRSFWS